MSASTDSVADPPYTMGIEIEFVCIYTEASFRSDIALRALAGISRAMNDAGIPCSDSSIHPQPPRYSQWEITTDMLAPSVAEQDAYPNSKGCFFEGLELISPKFDVRNSTWQAEVANVLNVLENVQVGEGCCIIVNRSTGLHVHVGSDGKPLPLHTAKNVFQLAVAFERLIDTMHTARRIEMPRNRSESFHSPPSFYFTQNPGTEAAGAAHGQMFLQLSVIESATTYEELGELFRNGPDNDGHYSAYNFDNIFPSTYNRSPKGTIEFRQHTGCLDLDEIEAWAEFVLCLTEYAHEASHVDMLRLCRRGANRDFTLKDFLEAIGCVKEHVEYFMARVGQRVEYPIFGQQKIDNHSDPQDLVHLFDRVREVNRGEQEQRSDPATIKTVMDSKSYGYHLLVDVPMSDESVDETYGSTLNDLRRTLDQDTPMDDVDQFGQLTAVHGESDEQIHSLARAQVFRQMAAEYKMNAEMLVVDRESTATDGEKSELNEWLVDANGQLVELEDFVEL